MKTIISIITLCVILVMPVNAKKLVGSKWIYTVSTACIDTIKFNRNNKLDYYSCESDCTIKGSYHIENNIITLIEKDDSHDEDNGKVTFYRLKFKLDGEYLHPISNEELVNGKWKKIAKILVENTVFHRIDNR